MTERSHRGGRRKSGDGLRWAVVVVFLLALVPPGTAPGASHGAGAGKAAGKAPGAAGHEAPESPGEAPVLEGRLGPDTLMEVGPEWRKGFEDYQPDPASLELIRSFCRRLGPDLQLDVVVGTWCGDSRREVPRLIKIQRILGQDHLPVTFWGVDRTKKSPPESVEGRTIERVPTFIVKYKGQEVGRIIETPSVSVEADLAEILSRAGKG